MVGNLKVNMGSLKTLYLRKIIGIAMVPQPISQAEIQEVILKLSRIIVFRKKESHQMMRTGVVWFFIEEILLLSIPEELPQIH